MGLILVSYREHQRLEAMLDGKGDKLELCTRTLVTLTCPQSHLNKLREKSRCDYDGYKQSLLLVLMTL